jgi:hypothetical protein
MVSQGPPSGPLQFTVTAPPSARVGERVPIRLRLTNSTDHPVEAHFLGRTVTFDIVVTSEDGVWRRLAQGSGQSILQIRMLAAGETMEWQDAWTPAARGRFRIQGILPSDDPEPRRTAWVSLEVR